MTQHLPRRFPILTLLSVLAGSTDAVFADAVSMDRAKGPTEANLTQMFDSWASWQEAFAGLESQIEAFQLRGEAPPDSPEGLLAALRARDEVHQQALLIQGYLGVRLDLDSADHEALERLSLFGRAASSWQRASQWLEPTLRTLGVERVEQWSRGLPALGRYSFYLQGLLTRADRPLPEAFRGMADAFERTSSRLYQALSSSEGTQVELSRTGGERLSLDRSSLTGFLASEPIPADRSRGQQALLEALGAREHSYAALLSGTVQRESLAAAARGFETPLAAFLSEDRIPTQAVRNLIALGGAHSHLLHRYHRTRKALAGLSVYGTADRYAPIFPSGRRYRWVEARELLSAALEPLGDQVRRLVEESFQDGWIDAVVRPRKRALGRATYVFGRHPYVLVTFQGEVRDVFQLAHELGHAIHSQLAADTQPFATSRYDELVGEAVAAVFTGLLADELTGSTRSPRERAAALGGSIEELLRFFYRPLMEADFELRLYRPGAPTSAAGIGKLYRQVLEEYLGEGMSFEDWDRWGWLLTPHFFESPLYMSRYGLAYAAGFALLSGLRAERPGTRALARGRVIGLMKAGGSDHPLPLLAQAGADLERPEALEAVLEELEGRVSALEELPPLLAK